MSWPVEHGGRGRSMVFTLILAEELEYFRAPGLGSNAYVAPALLNWGTKEQIERFIPDLRRGSNLLPRLQRAGGRLRPRQPPDPRRGRG
ncbi:MAG: acyl-CoA dehydrogenase family protein [Dehalococcoidia bacterium]